MTDEKKIERDAFLATLGIEYTATFVPHSQSRNREEKQPQINWHLSLKRNRVEIVTDYSQGIGHHPDWKQKFSGRMTIYEQDQYKACIASTETGIRRIVAENSGAWMGNKPLPAPGLDDVLYSLLSDGNVIDQTFEEFCGDMDLSTDSRKAEAMWKECVEIGIKVRRMFGEDLAKLQELFQDY